jgi:hypothetical protein
MRIGLTVKEVAWVLSRSESQVRRLLVAGHLAYAVQPTRVSSDSVRALFPDDQLSPVRESALVALLDDRVEAPAPASRYATPSPITELPQLLLRRT